MTNPVRFGGYLPGHSTTARNMVIWHGLLRRADIKIGGELATYA